MTDRIPTEAEAEALADNLVARGYPATEAAENFRIAFPEGDPDGVDGCLMFEGPNRFNVDRWSDEWAGVAGDDAAQDAVGSWLNAVTWAALVLLAERAGETRAGPINAQTFAYMRENWA